jgi:hypothetical protein
VPESQQEMKGEIQKLRKNLAGAVHQWEMLKNFGDHLATVAARYQMI